MDNVLHLYGPEAWHDDAFVVGTTEALTALRDAIDAALRAGRGACLSFTNDGEGFAAIVLLQKTEGVDTLLLPYIDEIARDGADQGRTHPATLFTPEDYAALIESLRTQPKKEKPCPK